MEINIAFRKETIFSKVGIGKDGLGILGVKMFIIKKYSYPIICICEYNIFIFKNVQLTL
jgi:hypothetical protein